MYSICTFPSGEEREGVGGTGLIGNLQYPDANMFGPGIGSMDGNKNELKVVEW
jgi:hypothetical protein